MTKQEVVYNVRTEINGDSVVQTIKYPCEGENYRSLIFETALEQRELIDKEKNGTSLELKLTITKTKK